MIKEPGSESFRISFAKEKENKTNCNKLVRVGSYQSDQHLISPYSLIAALKSLVLRIAEMIVKLWSVLKEMYRKQYREYTH